MTWPDHLKDPVKTPSKMWGKIRFNKHDNKWEVEGHPQMLSVLKRVFPGTMQNRGFATFPAQKRLIGELNWFMLRYPLEIEDKAEWTNLLNEARAHNAKLIEILSKPTKMMPPPQFIGQLREFQKEGLSFLKHNNRCLLADEMGLGKTPTALAWLSALSEGPPYLIVVQPHMLQQWKREIKKFLSGTIRTEVLTGKTPYKAAEADIYLTHYLLLSSWRTALDDMNFNALVFDEIHELRRKESAKYSAASLIAEKIPYAIGLSGTPFFNYGGEIWNVLNILEYHCLGDYDSFSREWCTHYKGGQIIRPDVFGAYLREEGLFIRRRKEDVLSELPPKRRVTQEIDIDQGMYAELINPLISKARNLDSIKDAFEKGRETEEIINETRRATGIAKARYVCAFVKALMEAGEPTILYAHHHSVVDIYLKELAKYNPVLITGRQNLDKKDRAQTLFMDKHTQLIIISLRSGTGLNLHRARCVVFGEMDWTPAVHTQCEDRAHRMGVRDSVLCYYLVADAGTDKAMEHTLGLKKAQFIGIMGDRVETEDDVEISKRAVKRHIGDVIETLKKGAGHMPKPSSKVLEDIHRIQHMPERKPTSIGEFWDELQKDRDEEDERYAMIKGISLDDFEGDDEDEQKND